MAETGTTTPDAKTAVSTGATPAAAGAQLQVSSNDQLKKELALADPKSIIVTAGQDANLELRAEDFVNRLVNFNTAEVQEQLDRKAAVEAMGSDLQKKASEMSHLLQQPVTKLSLRGAEGSDVANALVDLKLKVEELDPSKFDFEPGWFSRTVGMIPGVGTPLKKYFTKFESAQSVISSISRSLVQGKDQLTRDNITLIEDQKRMRDMTSKLEKAIQLGQIMDQKIQYRLERDIQVTDPKHKFISEELLFPLRQRIMDLQQQLAVNQQGVLATEIIIRNNKELVRGVDRALNVTISALEVGASVAMALANQKIVLDKVDAVNKTTSDLIAGTANRLKTQGVEIQTRAASTQLDLNALKVAFQDINQAMNDISEFRMKALPQMATTIGDLSKLTQEAEGAIKKMEQGNRSKPDLKFEIE